jgi:hypothetical protein
LAEQPKVIALRARQDLVRKMREEVDRRRVQIAVRLESVTRSDVPRR